MSDALQRISAALSGRYAVERELGRGGMATVYLARDVRHQRPVAVKVMSDEIAAAIGAERFLREIQIAASLTHPNVLPLLDSGETGGARSQPYYVTPFIEGESLREKISREGQLAVEDAVRLGREIADALHYAHDRGVIHRDIKPENILLSGGHAMVADFGVARALARSGGDSLTQTGTTVGTPQYMSPEQAAADPTVDGRSDVYALGTMLYEMLAGSAPYHGPTSQAILARKMAGSPPSLRVVRPTVPEPLERAIFKSMEISPADRFRSAHAFASALESAITPTAIQATGAVGPPGAPARRPARASMLIAAVVLAAGALAAWKLLGRPASKPVDAEVVAVLPFRVSGADTAVARYRIGMLELLHASLNGEGGARAVSPATLLSAWRREVPSETEDLPDDQALELARRLGAGRLLTGSIVAVPGKLVMHATLLPVGGGPSIEASSEGPSDSVLTVVDRLVADLLVRSSIGAARPQLGSLTTSSLPALKAYLDGQSAYRTGDFIGAVKTFRKAIALDSSFALAGMGLAKAAGWAAGGSIREGLTVAWRGRDRLSTRDRTQLEEYAGADFPGPVYSRDQLRSVERLVQLAPDDPEAWFELGDVLYHFGAQLDLPDAAASARRALERSLSLDSGFVAPLNHLIDLTGATGDTAALRRFFGIRRRLADQGSGPVTFQLWWRYARTMGDEAMIDSLRRAIGPEQFGGSTSSLALAHAEDLDLVEAASEARWRSGSTNFARMMGALGRMQVAENQGQPAVAAAWLDSLATVSRFRPTARFIEVMNGIYGHGDTTGAARAAAELTRHADSLTGGDLGRQRDRWRALAAAQLWRASAGDYTGLERVIEEGKTVIGSPQAAGYGLDEAIMVAMLEAIGESRREAGGPALRRLDSLLARGPQNWSVAMTAAGLEAARLWERSGDRAAALRAVRRRNYDWSNPNSYRAAVVGEEARLAALTGDKRGAIAAYQTYLRFLANAEPPLVPRRDRARAELARLLGEPQ